MTEVYLGKQVENHVGCMFLHKKHSVEMALQFLIGFLFCAGVVNSTFFCLTWELKEKSLSLICRIQNQFGPVSFIDSKGNIKATCTLNNPSKCETFQINGKAIANTYKNEVVFMINDYERKQFLNDEWTCSQGNRSRKTEVSTSRGILSDTDLKLLISSYSLQGVTLICFSCRAPDGHHAEFLKDDKSVDSIRYNMITGQCTHTNGECRSDMCSCIPSGNKFTRRFSAINKTTKLSCSMKFVDYDKSSIFSVSSTVVLKEPGPMYLDTDRLLSLGRQAIVYNETRTTIIKQAENEKDIIDEKRNISVDGSNINRTDSSPNILNPGEIIKWVGIGVAFAMPCVVAIIVKVCCRSCKTTKRTTYKSTPELQNLPLLEEEIELSELPAGMQRLSEEDMYEYKKLMTTTNCIKRHCVRIMLVGKESVGKTCLLKRLLKENIADTSSTDGVDIIIRRCKINIENGEWIIDKDSLKHAGNISHEEKREDIEDVIHKKNLIAEDSNSPNITYNESKTMTSPPNIEYSKHASCVLWDFQGQLVGYATQLAFLTSRTICILVSSMDDELEKIGEYVDFCFDHIHCYREENESLNHDNYFIEPPVVLVYTGKDRYKEDEQKTRKQALDQQLVKAISKQNKYCHYRNTFYLSNTGDSDNEFEVLRNKISEIAKMMQIWGEFIPVKWMLLEHLLEMNKDNGKHFTTFNDMVNIAQHPDIAIFDIDEVTLFLRFQCDIGNIIYYEDIPNLIILNLQWLSNAFRCLMSDKLDIDSVNNKVQICLDWNELHEKGKISMLLIKTLFKFKGGTQFEQQMDDLIKVMKKFDILVEIEDTDSYLMPSMMPISSFETVCYHFGVFDRNCQRTSWFCLRFSFLPPAFFYHLSAWLLTKFKPSTLSNDSEVPALYRGICVFNFDKSGCDKLLMTMSNDTIAVQVLSFANTKKKLEILCSEVRKELIRKIDGIIQRHKLKISYEQRFKCSDGHYYIDAIPFEDLKTEKYVYCLHHKSVHECKDIYLPWTMDIAEFTDEEISYLRIVALLQVAKEIVRMVFDSEFHPAVLHTEIYKAKGRIRKYLNMFQWKTLCRVGEVSSREFDLHLMLCFLKNTIDYSISNDFNPLDISKSSDLSRIWYCRTQMAMNVNGKLSKADFKYYWVLIIEAIIRLGHRDQDSWSLKCLRIKTCDLDGCCEISLEETNYLRILHLILNVAREVIRQYFDVIFDPSTLQETIIKHRQTLTNLQMRRTLITKYQWAVLMSGNDKVSSASLDIMTMVILVKYLKDKTITYVLPMKDSDTDTSNLSRIWWYRREVIHCNKFTMDQFENRWYNISKAVIRLGGNQYTDICKRFKTVPLRASEL